MFCLILVLEASTSSVKALLYCPETGIAGAVSAPYGQLEIGGRQNADGICNFLFEMGRSLISKVTVDCVVIVGTFHNVMLVGEDNTAQSAAFSWTWTQAAQEASAVRSDAEDCRDIYKRTGCIPHVTYSPYRLRHAIETDGLKPQKNDKAVNIATYITAKLTGTLTESVSMASGSGFLNINTLTWDDKVAAYTGLDENNYAPLCGHEDILSLSVRGASLLGLTPGIPVVPAHPDGAMNHLGEGGWNRDIMSVSVGTSGALRKLSPGVLLSDPPGTWCYYGPGSHMIGAAVAGGTNCVDWFVKSIMNARYTYQELNDSICLDEPSSVLFLPFVYGERCPGWDDRRMGGFYGLSPQTTASELYRAVLEGIVYQMYSCYRILETMSSRAERICVSGGILNAPVWLKIMASVFDRELYISKCQHMSLLGGAALGLLACGAIKKLSDFLGVDHEIIYPDKNQMYREGYARYLELYKST